MSNKTRANRHKQSGAAVLEFAIFLPIIILILIGTAHVLIITTHGMTLKEKTSDLLRMQSFLITNLSNCDQANLDSASAIILNSAQAEMPLSSTLEVCSEGVFCGSPQVTACLSAEVNHPFSAFLGKIGVGSRIYDKQTVTFFE